MDFEWFEYYEVAQELYDLALNNSDSSQARKNQARLRSSMSRAYYAALQISKEYLVERSFYYPSQDESRTTHVYIIRAFLSVRDPKARMIKQALEMLRDNRVLADYEKVFPLKIDETIQDKAQDSLAKAKLVIELIKKLQRQK
jgi:phosphoribosylformylglycinamidine (FGAM) synthase PurS component